ncbi:diadenylate cyclase CdaA [Deltaproteobacteria bacterium OttesenSCG-928-K17]|nr:diadenylate cyclase CdaA [Deltaproteobacteria bacterium OttesenSCG-928-K17]
MRWEDVIDIFLVTVLIYYVIKLVRGTRSLQVLLGLILVVATYILATKFEFMTTRYIISSFTSNLILVIVVLFSSDIRRGLARMARFSVAKSNPQMVDAVNEIVRASFFMAEKRIGALIAFERGVNLGEYVAAGAKVDAQVSDRLLLALFHTSSPLHDGAVVIQEGRLAAAGCFLPLLPSEDNVSRFFGTRHRAAIGLSRETDALVVVVSEERGLVSLVKDGEVVVMMGAANLRDRLLGYLNLTVEDKKTEKNKKKGGRGAL